MRVNFLVTFHHYSSQIFSLGVNFVVLINRSNVLNLNALINHCNACTTIESLRAYRTGLRKFLFKHLHPSENVRCKEHGLAVLNAVLLRWLLHSVLPSMLFSLLAGMQ